MKPTSSILRATTRLAFAALLLLQAHAALDGAKIEQITGLKGTLNEAEGVFKVASPRGDLPVSVDGWKMPPFMGLISRALSCRAWERRRWSWATSCSSRTR